MTGGRVVILGRTGRNMAAGMSGGIAYVLGLDPAMVNTAMVELQVPDPDDLVWLHDVVTRHARHTGSTLARSVLSDWPRRSAQFTKKIMPTDYRRVLEPPGWPRPKGVTWTPRSWRQLVADPPTGFLKVPKIEAAKRTVDERVGDWREVYERQDPPKERAGEVAQQARRCMDCGIPFCHSGTAGGARWAT